ncbi:hypothetical protein EDB92DRAFT_1955738 [Lactarius akahatsu]|uniref:Uncharacterized protein n=1 Tax=Lactarius akahatsu TaxID=416441 RepID=A0AAD4L3P3_9AGAM|nr:hypothetical protein EDB92DRAFT_1955738 [Lactarius akahatsu]
MASSSSATFSAFQRAVSPGAQAIHAALYQHDDSAASHSQNLRHAEILACASVDEILKLIPDDYRIHIADHLHSAQKAVSQLCATRTTVAKWEHHRSVGSLPAQLRSSATKLQFTAGYQTTDAAKASQKEIDDGFAAHQIACLDLMIAARKKEISFLEEATSPEKATLDMRSALAPHCASILERYKVPRDILAPDGSVDNVVWIVNPQAEAIRDSVLADCGVYAHRAISIALNVAKREALRVEKTKSLAAKAQVAAGDGDTVMGDATLASTIRAEVKRQVMGVMPRDKPDQSRGAGSSNLTKKARVAAAHTQAIVTGSGTGSGRKRSGPKPGKERVVVVAKAEGSQGKRKRRRGKGKGKQQQQQQPPMSEKRKGKQKAT